MKDKVINLFSKIRKWSTRVSNFILLLPVYLIGVGVSHILWRIQNSKPKQEDTYWDDAKEIPEEYEECLKQY